MSSDSLFVDYQQWTHAVHAFVSDARRTRVLPGSGTDSLPCAALGLIGELQELLAPEADVLLEAGDVLSYTMLATALLRIDVSMWLSDGTINSPSVARQLCPVPSSLSYPYKHAAQFAEWVKKRHYQGKSNSIDEAADHLRFLVFFVAGFAGQHRISLRDVMAANMKKLEERYPRGTR